tara:strand:+ start:5441 stop:6181 length:741 start_codon:yes stop_codon:yes gene_type:complete
MRKLNKKIILKKPTLILFDTDNTLYEYIPANKAAEEAVFVKLNNLIGIERKKFFLYYSRAKSEVKKNLLNTASSHSRLLYFQRMIELLGFNAQLLFALDLEQTFWRTFLANAKLFPNVIETLIYLKSKKIKIGVVTDLTSHIQLRKLTYFGLEEIFDVVVTSEEVGKDKPFKKNFLLAMKKLNLPDSTYFWMIGDNPIADIYGAKRIGGITFQKIHSKVDIGKDCYEPDFVFGDFSEFLKEIKKII